MPNTSNIWAWRKFGPLFEWGAHNLEKTLGATDYTGPVGGGYAFNHDISPNNPERWDMDASETH